MVIQHSRQNMFLFRKLIRLLFYTRTHTFLIDVEAWMDGCREKWENIGISRRAGPVWFVGVLFAQQESISSLLHWVWDGQNLYENMTTMLGLFIFCGMTRSHYLSSFSWNENASEMILNTNLLPLNMGLVNDGNFSCTNSVHFIHVSENVVSTELFQKCVFSSSSDRSN